MNKIRIKLTGSTTFEFKNQQKIESSFSEMWLYIIIFFFKF